MIPAVFLHFFLIISLFKHKIYDKIYEKASKMLLDRWLLFLIKNKKTNDC